MSERGAGSKLSLLRVQSVVEWALVSGPFDSNTGVSGPAQQTSEPESPFRKSHRIEKALGEPVRWLPR